MAKNVLQSTILSGAGAVAIAPGAQIEVRSPSGLLVPLWLDRDGTQRTTNPCYADADGFFRVYLNSGRYHITARSGAESREWRDVLLGSAAGYDVDDMLAALAAGIYTSVAEGLAETAEGDFFWVAHETGEDVLTLYRVVDGEAELWAALPRGDVVRELTARAESAAEAAEADAQAAADALAAILALGDLPSAVAAAEQAAQSASDSATAAATSESIASTAATAAEQAAQRAEEAAADTGLPSPIVPDTFLQAKADGSGYEAKTAGQVADALAADTATALAGLSNDTLISPFLLAEVLKVARPLHGYITGLRVSNNSADPDNDIDIAAGECGDSTGTHLLRLTSTLTKRLDATWAEGSGQGGLFAGSKAPSTTYYLFLIRRDSDGTVDAGFDADPSAANRPSGWSAYAPVWELAVHTDESGNLWQFEHNGDEAIVYPGGGSAASPGNVTINARYVIPSPFPGRNVMLHPELLFNGKWVTIAPGMASTGARTSAGVIAGQEGDEIIARTGTHYLIVDHASNPSTAESPTSTGTPLPCRVKVWKSKGAI